MTRKLRQNMKICKSFNYYFKINFKEYMFSSSRAYSTPATSKKFVSTYQDTSIPKERKQSMKNLPSNMSTQCWFNNSHHDIHNNWPHRKEFRIAIHWYDKLELKPQAHLKTSYKTTAKSNRERQTLDSISLQ